MIEIIGDLWEEYASGAVVVITTNGRVAKTGKSIMPRGCARQACSRFPELLKIHGALLLNQGNHVFDLGLRIVTFPVEEDPYQAADIKLIEQSCKELVALVNEKGWHKVVVPRPGCGGGGLVWSEVKPVVAKHLDDRFHVISLEE